MTDKEQTTFTVQFRAKEASGKGFARRLRQPKTGLPSNPGIVYGIGEPTNIHMYSDQALRFIRSHEKSGSNLIDLKIEKDGKTIDKKVILQDYQLQPANNKLLHVDFREVTSSAVVNLEVNIIPIGLSKAVKLGGVLQINRRTVMLRGKVSDIPSSIEVDVTNLDFGGGIHVLDLKLPAGITPVLAKGENYNILTISTAIEEEVAEAPVVAEGSAAEGDKAAAKADPKAGAKPDAKADAKAKPDAKADNKAEPAKK